MACAAYCKNGPSHSIVDICSPILIALMHSVLSFLLITLDFFEVEYLISTDNKEFLLADNII